MNIGILGSGDVAKSLAKGFLGRGDTVMLGTRDAAKLQAWKSESGEAARVGSFAETAQFGKIVLLGTLGTAVENAVKEAGAQPFSGKLVIDATNPLNFTDHGPELAWGFDDSNGERVQRALPQAKVVKAFNTTGSVHFVNPDFPGGPPTMFVAGNDPDAKRQVRELLESWGWEYADVGGIESSRYLEAMCIAWVKYALASQSYGHAFKMLHK